MSITNDMLNAILLSLENDFPNINKYIENVEQGFKTPCFFINFLDYNKENLNESDRFLREKKLLIYKLFIFLKKK